MVFLSLIGFTLRRTNVLETSLVFVYVVVGRRFVLCDGADGSTRRGSRGLRRPWSGWCVGGMTDDRPRQYGSGWMSPLPSWLPKELPTSAPSLKTLASRALSGSLDSVFGVARTLPPHLLLSLIYRVAVLHLAARIAPVIRKSSMGWDDGMDNDVGGFWDGRSLGEEPTVRQQRRCKADG